MNKKTDKLLEKKLWIKTLDIIFVFAILQIVNPTAFSALRP